MKPSTKLEHLLIPDLKLAFITSNRYHTLDTSTLNAEIIRVDLEKMIRYDTIRYQEDILKDSEKKMEELLEKAIFCLSQAKKEHDDLEKYYVPNMDFLKIDELRKELTRKISLR
jgi:hypothetical protein